MYIPPLENHIGNTNEMVPKSNDSHVYSGTLDGIVFILRAMADLKRYDGSNFSAMVLNESAARLERLQQIVTTDHESKSDFIARVREVLTGGQ